MATILCYDDNGNTVPVAPEALSFRPAVYGIFIENNQVLLLRHAVTGLWQPPGGVLAANESPTQQIRQIFRRLTGMSTRLGPVLYMEDLFLIDDERRAWHYAVLYFALERHTAVSAQADSATVEWIPLANLQRQQMQLGYEAVRAGRLQLKL